MSTATYTLERAKSARSKCVKCKTKIEKGELRIHYKSEDEAGRVFSNSTKLECFKLPTKYSSLTTEEFVDEILTDATEEKLLEDPDERKIILEKLNMTGPTKKKVKKDVDTSDLVHTAKRCADLISDNTNVEGSNEDNKPAKKKFKLSEEDRAMGEAYLKFKGMKNAELQDILSWNNVSKSGTKDALLTRVIDGFLHGRIAKCLACGKGQPKIADDGSHVYCSGYYDTNQGFHLPCMTKSKIKDVKRLKWYNEEPTEEEKEAMVKEEEETDTSDVKIPKAMMEAVIMLEWDLSSKANIKTAAKGLIELCSADESPIDFPADAKKAKMDVGKMILENKNKDALGLLEMIIEKYGMKQKNEEDAKKKSSNMASMVDVTENAGIYEALSELANIYFKQGNKNAGTTYKKVAAAVRNLNFVITEDNAKGLGKGKTKVDGIGKGSADKIHEFVTTGKIQKLEEKRAEVE